MGKQPNPTLWAVNYRLGRDSVDFGELWICAPNAKSAEAKARRVIKTRFAGTTIRITKIEWEGEIDAF